MRNRLQKTGLVIDQNHSSAAADRKVHEMLARPFLGHDLLGQVASRAADKIDLDLGISVFESQDGFADSGAWLPVNRNLAFLFGGRDRRFPVLLPVSADGSDKNKVEQQGR